jgi:hypothetical protein
MKQHIVFAALVALWLAGCERLSQPLAPKSAAPDTPPPTLPEWTAPPAPSITAPIHVTASV